MWAPVQHNAGVLQMVTVHQMGQRPSASAGEPDCVVCASSFMLLARKVVGPGRSQDGMDAPRQRADISVFGPLFMPFTQASPLVQRVDWRPGRLLHTRSTSAALQLVSTT
jgi:hypothetical protein